jgi:DNA-binding NarL/FixJ family response regulator
MAVHPHTLRVVIADDHLFFRQGLAKALTRSGIDVVAQAANGWAAIKAVEQKAPDVAVIDLNMPVVSGVEVIHRLTHRTPGVRVLALSVSAEEADVSDAFLAGASGYVLKEAAVEEIVAGIRAVAAGQPVISAPVASRLWRRIRERDEGHSDQPPVRLTERERKLLELTAEGSTSQEVGGALGIDPTTVRDHISGILSKLQAANRVQSALHSGLL